MTTPANPDDLLAFLRARYDDEEQVAREAHQPNWSWYTDDKGVVTKQDEAGEYEQWRPTGTRSDAVHIARHDPARVLADLDAKRRILDWCESALREFDRAGISGPSTPLDFVALLALPYADHPDYDPAWAPE